MFRGSGSLQYSRGRQYDLDAKTPDCAVPIVPWIHPPVHPKLQNLIVRIGRKIQLSRQDKLISLDRSISHLALVTSGVTARNFGNPIVGTENAAAISPPGHIAFGNFELFTERPAFGHYFALTKAEVVVCNKELLLPALKADPELLFCLFDILNAVHYQTALVLRSWRLRRSKSG